MASFLGTNVTQTGPCFEYTKQTLTDSISSLICMNDSSFNAISHYLTKLNLFPRSDTQSLPLQPEEHISSGNLPNKSNLTSLAAFSPSSRRFLSIIFDLSAAALSSALTVQPMDPEAGAHRPLARKQKGICR